MLWDTNQFGKLIEMVVFYGVTNSFAKKNLRIQRNFLNQKYTNLTDFNGYTVLAPQLPKKVVLLKSIIFHIELDENLGKSGINLLHKANFTALVLQSSKYIFCLFSKCFMATGSCPICPVDATPIE